MKIPYGTFASIEKFGIFINKKIAAEITCLDDQRD